MTTNKYQVVIIGAGPSGLATALNLKAQGIDDILVIERLKFPRYKCCAGYITSKTKKVYENLGLKIKNCHYSLIKDFNIFYKHKIRQSITNKFLYTNKSIDRVELDNAFYNLAKSKKINIMENTTIKEHDMHDNIILLSNDKKLEYNYLVFADGTNGYGSTYQKRSKQNIAIQATFKSSKKEEIQIHFGITKKGYAWVSSYDGITNVGLTDVYNPKNNYQEIYQEFLKKQNLVCSKQDIKGAFTPIGIKKGILNKNIYYVGDAVGACDPLTLSGLRYSLKSGEKCALAIISNKPNIYVKYLLSLKIKFLLMKIISHIFYFPIVLFLIFNIGCRFFSSIISFTFNNFFVNKK